MPQDRAVLGEDLLRITKNPALEGFTLPKILWVKEHEPEVFAKAKVFLLPKDYLRYRLTGQIHMDYSDAAGTLLLDVANKKWSSRVLEAFGLEASFCPPLVESHGYVGNLLPEAARETGLSESHPRLRRRSGQCLRRDRFRHPAERFDNGEHRHFRRRAVL